MPTRSIFFVCVLLSRITAVFGEPVADVLSMHRICVCCGHKWVLFLVYLESFFSLMLQPKCVCNSPLVSACPLLSLCVLLGCSSFCGRKRKREKLEQCCGNRYHVRLYGSG